MTAKAKTLSVVINLLVAFVLLSSAARGGWWLLLIPLALPSLFGIYRTFRPAGPSRVSPRFAEPGNHRVVLQVAGPSPVLVVRELRRTTGRDLQAAVELMREAPVIVVENLSESSAALVADRLTKAGARALAAPIGEK